MSSSGSSNSRPRNIVRVQDIAHDQFMTNGDAFIHKPGRVFIDGREVLITQDGLKVGRNDSGELTLTLTVQPTELHFEP